ncbi:hypothetical protein BZM27_06270 [Paraburkholderia steynii]|uniref:Uncharacterized protein n=1 Tax=Paraburkholderia steynii TaxID=1245441 RepID=A0A4V2NHL3_9BURK|nr:hypothetical protein BZM27_06270 [Paraburkholderia steynii]
MSSLHFVEACLVQVGRADTKDIDRLRRRSIEITDSREEGGVDDVRELCLEGSVNRQSGCRVDEPYDGRWRFMLKRIHRLALFRVI